MLVEQVRLGRLHGAGDHLVHRDAHRLGLRHGCGVTAGILGRREEAPRGYKLHRANEPRGQAVRLVGVPGEWRQHLPVTAEEGAYLEGSVIASYLPSFCEKVLKVRS